MRPGQRLVDEPLVPRVRCIQLGVAVRAVRRPPALHGRDPLVGPFEQPYAWRIAETCHVGACRIQREALRAVERRVLRRRHMIESREILRPFDLSRILRAGAGISGEAGDEPVLGVSRELAEQQRLEEREDAVVEIGPRRARVSQHGVDEPAIGGCGRHAWAHVAAVRGRVHAELDDSVSQLGSGEVARPSVALAHPQQELYDPIDVRGE